MRDSTMTNPLKHPRRTEHQRGSTSPVLLLAIASVLVIAGLVVAGLTLRGEGPLADGDNTHGPPSPIDRPLRLYCAAGLRVPTQQILNEYERQHGVKIELHTHGSGTLFSQLCTEAAAGQGPDLYLTAESSYMDQGRELGLIEEVIPIGTQRAVLIVRMGNPKQVTSLGDLIDPAFEIDFGIANQGAAIGKKTREIAEAMGIREDLETMRKSEQETVVALADAVRLGSLDAAIVWDTTARMTDGVEIIPTTEPAFDLGVGLISIGLVSTSNQPGEALRLARFITSADQGLPVYRANEIEPVGDE